MLSTSTSFHCLLRVWFMGAAMTTHGMQHLGLLYALDPGLVALHKDSLSLNLARKRYLMHINTHPFMAPILVGFLLAIEGLVATHKMPVQNMQSLINTTAETLSAIGDSFFSGSLMVFWALVTIWCILQNALSVAIIFSISLLALLLFFRVWFYFLGLRHGLLVLTKIRSLNLINQASVLKSINALLIACIYWSICIRFNTEMQGVNFLGIAGLIALGAFLINTAHIPRVVLVTFSFFVFVIYWLNYI